MNTTEVELLQRYYPQIYLARHNRHIRASCTGYWLSARDPSILEHLSYSVPVTLTELAATLMRIFAIALDLDETFFDDKIDRHISRLRVRSFCAKPLQREISLPQLHVLGVLHENCPMTVPAVAHLFGTSLRSASPIAARMEARGMVTRTREEGDRRLVTVEITERGREVVEEFAGIHRALLDHLLQAMSDVDLKDLSRGLAALQRGIQAADTATPTPAAAPSSDRQSTVLSPG